MANATNYYSIDLLPVKSTVNLDTKLFQYRIDIKFSLDVIENLIKNSTGELNNVYIIIKNIIGDMTSKIDSAYSLGATGQEKISDIDGMKELIQEYANRLNNAKSLNAKSSSSLLGIAALTGAAALIYYIFKK